MKRNSKNMEHISSSYNKFLDNEEGITPPPRVPTASPKFHKQVKLKKCFFSIKWKELL